MSKNSNRKSNDNDNNDEDDDDDVAAKILRRNCYGRDAQGI